MVKVRWGGWYAQAARGLLSSSDGSLQDNATIARAVGRSLLRTLLPSEAQQLCTVTEKTAVRTALSDSRAHALML